MQYALETCWIRLEDFLTHFMPPIFLDTPWKRRQPLVFWCFQRVSKKISGMKWVNKNSLTWWYVLKTFWRHLYYTSWRYLEDLLKMFLQDVVEKIWKRLDDVWPIRIYWYWSRRLEDVFWRCLCKANIFVLIKTSSEDEDERRLKDVFIKTNVCWVIFPSA